MLSGIWSRRELSPRLRDICKTFHWPKKEVAHDAVVAALEVWAERGIPEKPAAWLMTTAKNRATDLLRRQQRYRDVKLQLTQPDDVQETIPCDEAFIEENLDDDVLRLMFMLCHPLLSADARVALTLRLVNGLSVSEIARAFLTPKKTIAQRITRAKRTLKAAHIPFELPHAEERQARLTSVLDAIYLIFNEGYTAFSGEQWMRPTLCNEALRLARSLTELSPEDTETLGLTALLEFQISRFKARVDNEGEAVLLEFQDRSKWDYIHIHRGFQYLKQAFSLQKSIGSYCIQAAIAACHARASQWQDTDWQEIAALYDGLMQAMPSAIVALNRAIVIAKIEGPETALQQLEEIEKNDRLKQYHLFYSVRADLLLQCNFLEDAHRDFLKAANLTENQSEKRLLQKRAAECFQIEKPSRH